MAEPNVAKIEPRGMQAAKVAFVMHFLKMT